LEYTRRIHEVEFLASSSSSHNRGRNKQPQPLRGGTGTDLEKQRIISRIAELEAEVEGCRVNITEIQTQMEIYLEEKETLERQLAESISRVDTKGKRKAKEGINYMTEPFDWSDGLKAQMKAVFGIQSFRLCQEG
jgi:ATP-dependent DNA helicase Q1